MSFVRPELVARLRPWREAMVWGALLGLGLWLMWIGYARGGLLPLVAGGLLATAGAALLRAATRRLRLHPEAPGEGVVMIDEGRIGYFGPREGGFVDLPSVVRVEIVTRPVLPPGPAHAWQLTAEDGTRLTIPLGAEGAERMIDALSPLPGIDFGAGVAAVVARGPGRTLIWKKAG